MTVQTLEILPALYELDETAWLDLMADLAREGRVDELDLAHLAEYLSDMARRDRREVGSRLVVLLMHLLKWQYQPDQRSRSWRGTIVEQRHELCDAVGKGVLLNHARDVLAEVYRRAVERTITETDLPASVFPIECPFSLDQLLNTDLTAEVE